MCRNKDIAIVATENNTIYVYDVTPGDTIQECYHKNTNASGEKAIPFTDLAGTTPQCNNLVPQEGITGTPAIDTSVTPPALYFVSAVKTSSTNWDFKLNVMTLNNGSIAHGAPYYLSSRIQGQTGGSNFSALYQNQRAGLALFRPTGVNEVNLYVGFGSHCDSKAYQGYVAGFQFVYGNPPTLNNLGVFNSENASGGSQGGIWMSGAAPALDANSHVYVAVGNGAWNGQPNSSSVPTELGQSVVQLAQSGSSLTAVDYYTPNDYAYLNNGSKNSQGTYNDVCVANNPGSSCPAADTFTLTTNDYDLGAAGVTMINPVGSGLTSLCGTSNGELIAGGKGRRPVRNLLQPQPRQPRSNGRIGFVWLQLFKHMCFRVESEHSRRADCMHAGRHTYARRSRPMLLRDAKLGQPILRQGHRQPWHSRLLERQQF